MRLKCKYKRSYIVWNASFSNLCLRVTAQEYLDCEIIALPKKYSNIPMSFGFPKYSPYLEIFNYHIQRLRETGTMSRIFPKNPPQICADFSGEPLGFENIGSGFLVLVCGMGSSLLILLLEFIKNTTKGKDKDNPSVLERRKSEIHGNHQLEPPEDVEQDSTELDVTVVECH